MKIASLYTHWNIARAIVVATGLIALIALCVKAHAVPEDDDPIELSEIEDIDEDDVEPHFWIDPAYPHERE